MDVFDLSQWQDSVLLKAKMALLGSGQVPTAAFLYAFKSHLPAALLAEMAAASSEGVDDHHAIIGVMLEMPVDQLFQVIRSNPLPGKTQKDWEATIDHLLEVGKGMGVKDPAKMVVESVFKMTGLCLEDLQSFVLAKTLTLTKAVGYVKVFPCLWQPVQNRKKVPIDDDPDLRKAIGVLLETESSARLLVLPYYVGGMEEEQISFGDVEEVIPTEKYLGDFMKDDLTPALGSVNSKTPMLN